MGAREMTALKTFHLIEANEPHPLVAEALSAELFERCRIDQPVPVHFLPMPRWGGMCPAIEDTRAGEVELADDLLDPQKSPRGMQDQILQVYLHEFAHRLTPGHRHDPAFFAMNAVLFLRADKDSYQRSHLQRMDLYDLQDFDHVDHCTMGEALDWALAQAAELSKTDLSAEACAVGIMERFKDWKEWKAGTEQRAADAEAQAEAARRQTEAAIEGLQSQVERLKQARWNWLSGGVVVGTLINLVFLFMLRGV